MRQLLEVLSFLLASGAGGRASAQTAPLSPPAAVAERDRLSAFERSVIDQELASHGFSLEAEPEGKFVEAVEIVTLDVFDERDPMPDFVNVFHTTTRKRVIARELLFEIGAPYTRARVEESARNLRDLKQLSLVLLVPVRGSRADRVRVLVITKDVWSLRLNSDVRIASDGLQYLLLNPTESNLFGTHASIGGLFILQQGSYSAGGLLSQHRILGTRLEGSLAANLVYNRASGAAEGSFGSFRFGQPLYSLNTEWAWGTAILWLHDVARRYVGATLATYDAAATPGVRDRIPIVYGRERLYGGYELTRSFGHHLKYDFTFGIEADRRAYRPRGLDSFDPQAAQEFVENQIPVSDQRVSPFVQLHAFRAHYLSLLDVETLGLQEDYRMGHDFLLRVYPAASALGSTRDLLGIQSVVSYTAPLGDGLVRAVSGSTIEYARNDKHDALYAAALRVVSPRTGFGRALFDGVFFNRFQNYLNRRYGLGGEGRLRGYPSNAFVGGDAAALSVEFRSTSLDMLSAQVGAAAFFDCGDAVDRFRDFNLKSSTGLGLRILFPELDRIVFRADWGFPLSRGYQTFPGALFVSFGQAFTMPVVEPHSVTTENFL